MSLYSSLDNTVRLHLKFKKKEGRIRKYRYLLIFIVETKYKLGKNEGGENEMGWDRGGSDKDTSQV